MGDSYFYTNFTKVVDDPHSKMCDYMLSNHLHLILCIT